MHSWGSGWGMGAGMGWMMGFWWLAWLLIIVAVVWAVARGFGASRTSPIEDTPETILKRRYARGEITREEYQERLAEIRK